MFSEDVKCYIPSGYVDLGLPSGTLWATCNIGRSVRPVQIVIN